MKPILIHAYKRGLKSVAELRERLDLKNYTTRRYDSGKFKTTILNWGSSGDKFPYLVNKFILNTPTSVGVAANKRVTQLSLRSFMPPTTDYFYGVPEGVPIIIRTDLKGSGGRGTHYYDCKSEVPDSVKDNTKLISRYIPKTAEYRVHVFGGKAIHVQEKKRRQGDVPEGVESKIRSYSNGWIFCQEEVKPPPTVLINSVKAVVKLGLHFGAVDVIWNRFHGVFITEVNTAPGIEGTTADKYAEAILNYYK